MLPALSSLSIQIGARGPQVKSEPPPNARNRPVTIPELVTEIKKLKTFIRNAQNKGYHYTKDARRAKDMYTNVLEARRKMKEQEEAHEEAQEEAHEEANKKADV